MLTRNGVNPVRPFKAIVQNRYQWKPMRIEIYLWNQFKQTNTSQDLVVKTILVQLEAVAGYTVT